MTHDELLKKLSSTNRRYAGSQDNAALRAVVELHKPQEITLPDGSWGLGCEECDTWAYPCPTIKAIEKELG